MKQIMVLEKSDLQRLKRGESLKLSLPDGKFLEMIVEGASGGRDKAAGNNGEIRGKITSKQAVLQALKDNGGWMKYSEVAREMSRVRHVTSGTLAYLLKKYALAGSPYKRGSETFNRYKYKGDRHEK